MRRYAQGKPSAPEAGGIDCHGGYRKDARAIWEAASTNDGHDRTCVLLFHLRGFFCEPWNGGYRPRADIH